MLPPGRILIKKQDVIAMNFGAAGSIRKFGRCKFSQGKNLDRQRVGKNYLRVEA